MTEAQGQEVIDLLNMIVLPANAHWLVLAVWFVSVVIGQASSRVTYAVSVGFVASFAGLAVQMVGGQSDDYGILFGLLSVVVLWFPVWGLRWMSVFR